jgi:hypothetical protein
LAQQLAWVHNPDSYAFATYGSQPSKGTAKLLSSDVAYKCR